jgi:rfaE bifunctional protein nucleotidyltransferase chain/domain
MSSSHANTKTSFISKIVLPGKLRPIMTACENEGTRVVFTNGCFDLLHKGHVTYLEKAKELGDLLVVALNSDESIRQLKGSSRPLIPLADRLEVVAALGSVDFVTWFEEETPVALIKLLQPPILVKGGDWVVDQILGSKEVLSRGGKVYSLPYIQGHSTTELIARARGECP